MMVVPQPLSNASTTIIRYEIRELGRSIHSVGGDWRRRRATISYCYSYTHRLNSGEKKLFLQRSCFANNITNNLFHLSEPFLRKNVDIPGPFEEIAGKGAARARAIFERRIHFLGSDVATVNAQRRSKQAQSPQARQAASGEHGVVSLTHLFVCFET